MQRTDEEKVSGKMSGAKYRVQMKGKPLSVLEEGRAVCKGADGEVWQGTSEGVTHGQGLLLHFRHDDPLRGRHLRRK